jgi:opacity protein-like surface antigen
LVLQASSGLQIEQQQQQQPLLAPRGALSAITAAAAAAVAAASAAAAADSQNPPLLGDKPQHDGGPQDPLNPQDELAALQQQLAAARKDAAKVPALHATAKAATEHALQLEQQLQEALQQNVMLQQQMAEFRAAQQREREQAAVLAGNGSAMAQQLAAAQREAEGLRQVSCDG